MSRFGDWTVSANLVEKAKTLADKIEIIYLNKQINFVSIALGFVFFVR